MAEMGATISLDGWQSIRIVDASACYLHFASENPEDGKMYLLVPAHTGCPGQSPESYKMVVCVSMSLSCTIIKIFSIISENSKRSHDCDHAHLRDYLSIRRLILHMTNQCTTFEFSSLSCSRGHLLKFLGGLKI